ncbi:helix-turn-helix domain-containing protein [Emticicia sp. SJ17W-69]|uniref:helix-turn-helix domain-containing protein n=1 Tax=Emticicia sp. SJ17W-69 TaxID=3421657 RepID=UPI003EBD553B
MQSLPPIRIKTITDGHKIAGLEKPNHPLISLVDVSQFKNHTEVNSVIFDFYVISIKRGCDNLIYGQQKYDFDEGLMAFMSPGQILRGEAGGTPPNLRGWMLFIHPDFLWNSSLASKIKKYDFFNYAANEALFLSEKEEVIINGIIENIRQEYNSNIDTFSQEIIISYIETLLNYAQRFYNRQFITRKKTNHQILEQLENILNRYFEDEEMISKGLPTVQYVSDQLNLSASYLRGLLTSLTGLSTQQHIHEKLISKAKERLSTTELSVSEIAYELGFEHPQSFSKLFKTKTLLSPLEFRESFN